MALCLSNVEEEVKEHVYPAFISGVEGLERFVEVLQNVHSVVTKREVDKVASKLRPHVTRAYTKFEEANKKAAEMNARIDREVEASVAQQHQIQCDIRRNEAEENSLSSRIDNIRSNVSDAENQVRDAKSNLSSAESTLSSARDKLEDEKKTQLTVAIVGAVITPIPIIGWIAGPTMVIVSLTALEDDVKRADNVVDSSRDNVRTNESRLDGKRKELRDLESGLSSIRRQRKEKQTELSQRQGDLKNKKAIQKRVLDMSEKLKYLTTFLARTRGRTKVLRDEFQTMYSLDTIREPLRAIAAHFQLENLGNNRLLWGEIDFTSLGNKFQMICDKTSVGMITGVEDFA